MTHIVREIQGIEIKKNAYENGQRRRKDNTDKSKWQVFFDSSDDHNNKK